MIPGKSTAAFMVVCCAALLDSGRSFTPSLAHRRGMADRGGMGSASRGTVAAWATKRRPTLGPCLETLGLRRGATLRDAKVAFRQEVRAVHPDRNPTPEAAERYAQLTEAYAVATEELRGRHNNAGGGGGSSDVFDFAQAVAGFAQAFIKEVAVPITRDVAAPVAQYMCQSVVDETMAPFWHRAMETAASVAQGRTWAAANAAADQAARAMKAQIAKTHLEVAQEVDAVPAVVVVVVVCTHAHI
jgi:hypothetical protein